LERSAKIHFIGIGAIPMYDIAIELKRGGHTVSGSDESIVPHIQIKLASNGLKIVPGWNPGRLAAGHTIVAGPLIRNDNPEINRARELKLEIHSLPDFVHKVSEDKQRLVVTGSSGRSMITALIMHVLTFHKRQFDFVTAAWANGSAVRISSAPLIIIEGQEVISSVPDRIPAFLQYQHHIGVVSGIEWQRSDDYPTREEYTRQFNLFGQATPKGGVLIYVELDHVKAILSPLEKPDVVFVSYKTHASIFENGQEFLLTPSKERIPLKITGKHNLQSISAAQEAVKKIGITSEMFYQAIPSFSSPN
jgi:UDP-N-acetylmuramate: L-alanyl-gamma-D-glutamyl-meso-diaminopimelate ligase